MKHEIFQIIKEALSEGKPSEFNCEIFSDCMLIRDDHMNICYIMIKKNIIRLTYNSGMYHHENQICNIDDLNEQAIETIHNMIKSLAPNIRKYRTKFAT